MSSNILEQAIIDAKALREAALKNAETAVLEKYAEEVRGAIDLMLEEETETLEEQDIMSPEAEAAEPVLAAAEGEDLCGCPDQDEEVEWELSLDDLRAMSDAMPEGEPMMDPAEEEEELALQEQELGEAHCGRREDEEELEEVRISPEDDEAVEGHAGKSCAEAHPGKSHSKYMKKKKVDEGAKPDFLDLDKDGDKEESMKAAAEDAKELDEDIELDEEMVREIVEELVVDIKPQKSGWVATPDAEKEYAQEQELARTAGTEAREEHEALEAAIADLTESKESVVTENEKLKQLIYDLKGKLDESILSNAKLLYTNQTLRSASLNERQKNRIVESIQNADSVEEAKVIYETLQSAAGPSTKKAPKSLSEAISRPSLQVSRRRNENKGRESVAKNRFQRLAGIKNK